MTQDAVAALLKQVQDDVRKAREDAGSADKARTDAFDELRKDIASGSKSVGEVQAKIERISTDQAGVVTKLQSLEETLNVLSKKINRPGSDNDSEPGDTRAQAIGLLEAKHYSKVTKQDPDHPFKYTEDQVTEAQFAIKALHSLMHSTHISNLPHDQQKALSSFNLGASGFILAPEMSATVLSCLVDDTDLSGLMQNLTISGPSVKFMVDNEVWDIAAWACETQCFANNPTQQIGEGLGEIEVKPESLRYIVCASRDLLDDASVNIEQWLFGKVNRAFRSTISNAIVSGDGVGKPLGFMNPAAGIPICDTSDNTPAGQLTWQDLVLLKWQVPLQFQAGGGQYLMNQNTFGQVLTLSDASGRPIMVASPTQNGQYLISGSGVTIATQMPNVEPGSTPVAYGNWKQAYMVVNRKAVTMQQDPYSAGFCILFKFEARIGGAIICPLAARLLRIG